jgi:hypothetical protein
MPALDARNGTADGRPQLKPAAAPVPHLQRLHAGKGRERHEVSHVRRLHHLCVQLDQWVDGLELLPRLNDGAV